MGNISYTAHVSNKKSAITSKSKLAAVAKHNLRKYKSSDYSKDNICIIYGTSNLIDDVKTVYHKEFDEALEEYNKKQTRPDRKIEDYFEHVAGGYKKGLSKQVSKRKIFTKDVLSRVLQDELREMANKEVDDWFREQIKEKSKGRNHDLSVAEYKVD